MFNLIPFAWFPEDDDRLLPGSPTLWPTPEDDISNLLMTANYMPPLSKTLNSKRASRLMSPPEIIHRTPAVELPTSFSRTWGDLWAILFNDLAPTAFPSNVLLRTQWLAGFDFLDSFDNCRGRKTRKPLDFRSNLHGLFQAPWIRPTIDVELR
ncbi:MAG: hypothetical protein DNFNHJIP_00638 [Candidatus Argoarchaeum ethanivorans]|uniref:Uncharacterized protein n=1 Tax=Candidatus Argoarchaeum ethanivorans TaxID=2608793 RepID=A0A812A1H9_9EURY|nr:MAG: hypothetical protein DNFNHJIP_00638 [Candidatus Argoarchaeum ethanivorans]